MTSTSSLPSGVDIETARQCSEYVIFDSANHGELWGENHPSFQYLKAAAEKLNLPLKGIWMKKARQFLGESISQKDFDKLYVSTIFPAIKSRAFKMIEVDARVLQMSSENAEEQLAQQLRSLVISQADKEHLRLDVEILTHEINMEMENLRTKDHLPIEYTFVINDFPDAHSLIADLWGEPENAYLYKNVVSDLREYIEVSVNEIVKKAAKGDTGGGR